MTSRVYVPRGNWLYKIWQTPTSFLSSNFRTGTCGKNSSCFVAVKRKSWWFYPFWNKNGLVICTYTKKEKKCSYLPVQSLITLQISSPLIPSISAWTILSLNSSHWKFEIRRIHHRIFVTIKTQYPSTNTKLYTVSAWLKLNVNSLKHY